MKQLNFPRRKVVKAWRDNDWTCYWHCLLSCSHTEIACSVRDKHDYRPKAPKAVGCRQCWREKKEAKK